MNNNEYAKHTSHWKFLCTVEITEMRPLDFTDECCSRAKAKRSEKCAFPWHARKAWSLTCSAFTFCLEYALVRLHKYVPLYCKTSMLLHDCTTSLYPFVCALLRTHPLCHLRKEWWIIHVCLALIRAMSALLLFADSICTRFFYSHTVHGNKGRSEKNTFKQTKVCVCDESFASGHLDLPQTLPVGHGVTARYSRRTVQQLPVYVHVHACPVLALGVVWLRAVLVQCKRTSPGMWFHLPPVQ